MTINKSENVFERLDLSLLRHFFAIASFGGFSKASRATGLSQPALSLGLQKLEKALGTKLVDRKPGEFSLTEPGRIVHAFCRRLEGSLESMVDDLGAGNLNVPRRLRIGAGLSVGFGPLIRACLESRSSNHTIELELTAQNTYQLLKDVSEGGLDAAIVPDDVYDKRLKISPLFRDRLVFVHSPSQKAAFSAKNWATGSLDSCLVNYPRETPMRMVVDRLCGQHSLKFKSVISVNGLDAIVNLVARNVGGAFVLKSLVSHELQSKRLQESRVPFELPMAGVALLTAHGDHGDDVAKTLKRWL